MYILPDPPNRGYSRIDKIGWLEAMARSDRYTAGLISSCSIRIRMGPGLMSKRRW